jgi:hypothetical protein
MQPQAGRLATAGHPYRVRGARPAAGGWWRWRSACAGLVRRFAGRRAAWGGAQSPGRLDLLGGGPRYPPRKTQAKRSPTAHPIRETNCEKPLQSGPSR